MNELPLSVLPAELQLEIFFKKIEKTITPKEF